MFKPNLKENINKKNQKKKKKIFVLTYSTNSYQLSRSHAYKSCKAGNSVGCWSKLCLVQSIGEREKTLMQDARHLNINRPTPQHFKFICSDIEICVCVCGVCVCVCGGCVYVCKSVCMCMCWVGVSYRDRII